MVRINKIGPKNVNVFAKLEYFNPMSSVKDRLALGLINEAERTGKLLPGGTIVEGTSGNTGIALAMIAAVRGYKFVSCMSESFSVERVKLMKALGAKVVRTPAAEAGVGMVRRAEALAKERGWFYPSQFANAANPDYHAKTTGAEIVSDFRDIPLYAACFGWGTGGTLCGVSRTLRAASPATKIVVVEPEGAQLLAGHEWKPHKIQGIVPNFITQVLTNEEGIQGRPPYDAIQAVTDTEAINMARLLAQQEGIFCGISGGANIAAAFKLAESAPENSNILTIIPDTGERYLSTALFEGITDVSDEV